MNDKERVIDRVRKILALSQSPFENEAIAAAEKAQALILEHNLTNDDVDAAGDRLLAAQFPTDARPWRRPIAMHLAKMYLCLYFVTTQSRDDDIHNFFGPEQSVVVTREMFGYLTKTVSRLARKGSSSVIAKERAAYQASFESACAVRICVRLRERMKQAERGEIRALAGNRLPALLISDQIQKNLQSKLEGMSGVKMGALPTKMSTDHGKGMVEGYDAGDKIGLDAQVRKNKSSMIQRR